MGSPAGVPPIITRRADPDRDPDRCAWFLACESAAIYTVEHATLGEVPACGPCLERVGILAPMVSS